MTLITDSLTVDALTPLTELVEVLAPIVTANPYLNGATLIDWDAATVTVTVLGAIYPAGTRALERVGRLGKTGVHELVTRPVSLTPTARVRINERVYSVVEARVFDSVTHAVVEEVASGEGS